MKRFKIELNKDGVAIWDTINKVYVLDASLIQKDNQISLCKRMVKRRKQFKWELKIEFKVK